MFKARRSRTWVLVLVSLAVALSWSSAFFAWRASGLPAGAVRGVPAIRPDMSGALGVNLQPPELEGEDIEKQLEWVEENGVNWVRMTLRWDQIEPRPGEYVWLASDRLISALERRPATHVLLVLDGSPAWARAEADASNPLAPPDDLAAFGRFAAAVARRYGESLEYYQVWNEPNIAPHWGARPVDPLDYLGLLREAAVQIHAVDPDAKIVMAALAPTTETGGANLSDISFLDAVYHHGGREWFDVVAAQPYGFTSPPLDPPNPDVLNFGRVALLREIMVQHGDENTPIWATAFGWYASQPGQDEPAGPWVGVSEAEQAEYAAAAIALARTEWPWLGLLFWPGDCSAASAAESSDLTIGFALCSADGTTRPIAEALTAEMRQPPVLRPGEHAANHPGIRYSPGWRVTSEAADPATNGDSVDFQFFGTGLSLRIQGTRYWAYYRIAVDGEPANALPRDETGAAYMVLHDPFTAVRDVRVARGLAAGIHRVTIEAVGGWDQWAMRDVLVEAQPVVSGWRYWLLAAGLATLAWLALAYTLLPSAAVRARSLGGRVVERLVPAQPPKVVPYAAAFLLALLFALSPSAAVSLLALGALGCLFLIAPWVALPLIAASVPFWPDLKPLLRWQITYYEAFVWLAVGAVVLRWAGTMIWREALGPGAGWPRRNRLSGLGNAILSRSPWKLEGLDWAVLALVLVGLAATLAAQRVGIAVAEFRPVILGGALFYWLVTRVARPGADSAIWPLLDGLVAGMVLASGLAVWQLITGNGRIDVEGVWRVRGAYGSPNNLALVLDRTIPLSLAVALFGTTAKARRATYGAATLLMVIACIATFSKGALLLGLPVGCGIVLLGGAWRARLRWPLVFLLISGLAAVGLLALLFQTPRFADLLNFRTGTSFIRLRLWQSALQMALDHPLLGVGPDNFLYEYRTRYVLPSAWQELNLNHPHNILLDLWTRLGMLGVIAGGWAIWSAIRLGWRQFRRGAPPLWPVALGVLAGLATTVSHGLIDNSLFLIDLMAIFMLYLGIVERVRRSVPMGEGTTTRLAQARSSSALKTSSQ